MSAIPATAAAVTPPRSRNRAWAKFKRNRIAMLGLGIVLFFVLVAILAPFIVSQDPLQTSFTTIRKAPSASYWLGTDELGRDSFSRMVYGARASLMAGRVSVLIALVVGVPFGLAAGYFGGWTDSVISRATEALLAIPFLILAIALAAFLGPSLTNAMIAIGVSAAPKFIRLTRGQVLAVKNEDYVQSARALGASDLRI
ncbi:MAG: ABC transporter permease, partial [Achromobacter mucicolens]